MDNTAGTNSQVRSGKQSSRDRVRIQQWGRPGVNAVQIGSGLKIAVPVLGSSAADIGKEWRAAVDAGADIIEWRIDGITDPQLEMVGLKLRDLYRVPVLVTLRTKPEGGKFPMRESSLPEYRRLVLQAAHWADAVDIEFDVEDSSHLATQVHDLGASVVFSHHELSQAPTFQAIQSRLGRMVEQGADVAKIAWIVESEEQVRVVEAAQVWAAESLEVPAAVIGMGDLGSRTRIGESASRSAFTFAVGAKASAPGQLSVSQVRKSVIV